MNIITDRQITWNGDSFPKEYDTVKVFEEGRKYYKHDDETFATKSALRRALSSEYGGAWIEEKDGKKRYFIDESGWLQRSIREVSKEEFAKTLETPSTWQKVLGIGLGVLALAPGAIEFARHIPKEAGLGLLALQQKSPLLGAVGYSYFPSSADAQAMGTEFQVNTYTASSQEFSSVAPLNDGGFVVTWTSDGQDGDLEGIYGQRYNASGARAGTEFQINTYTTRDQERSSVAPLNDGGFIVTWDSDGQDGDIEGIYGQRYNASGAQAGTEFQVNTYTTSRQWYSSVAPLNDGGFVVTWESLFQDGSTSGIYGQRYNATGAPDGLEFQVNSYTTNGQRDPSVASLNDGGFVITWESFGQDGDQGGIYGQRYNVTGAQAGTEFQVNTYTTSNQFGPSVAPLNNGGFVVTWASLGQDGSSYGIYGQRYNATGARAGTEFQVNTYTTSDQLHPSVAPLNDGGVVVTWTSWNQDGHSNGIFGQRYNATEARTGTEFQVNTYATGDQQRPSVAPLNDGGVVVSWESNGQDGDLNGIYGQRYDSNGTAVGPPSQASSSSALLSQMSTSAFQSSSTPSPSQIISTSSPNLDTSGASLTSSAATTSRVGTQSSPTSMQGLLSSAPSSTSGTTALSSNLNQSQPYTSSQNSLRTPPGSAVPSSTSSRPIPSGLLIYSVIDIVYGESYPIYINGITVGTYTISGGSGLLDSGNSNVITMLFNPSFAPEEEDEFIPLFSIPSGQAPDWQSIQLGDSDFECLEAHAEINPSTSGGTEFGLVFTGADSCTASGPQIVAGILPIMMN